MCRNLLLRCSTRVSADRITKIGRNSALFRQSPLYLAIAKGALDAGGNRMPRADRPLSAGATSNDSQARRGESKGPDPLESILKPIPTPMDAGPRHAVPAFSMASMCRLEQEPRLWIERFRLARRDAEQRPIEGPDRSQRGGPSSRLIAASAPCSN